MKCNIARDLIPLYNEKLCEEETARELEQHLEKCGACRALTARFEPEPETGGKDIKPFKKIGRKFFIGRLLILLLTLVILAVVWIIGSLTYGELNKGSGYQSFSGIIMDIRVRKIGDLFAKGDIDAFSEYIFTDTDYSDILTEKFKAAYREELAGQKCRITGTSTGSSSIAGETRLDKGVTFEFENSGEITVMFIETAGSRYRMYAQYNSDMLTAHCLNFIYNFDYYDHISEIIDSNTRGIGMYFRSQSSLADNVQRYDNFAADGSEISTFISSAPLYDEDTNEFYSKCMMRLRDGSGNEAVIELNALLGYGSTFSADTSSIRIINRGMSEEKIAQALEIITIAENEQRYYP